MIYVRWAILFFGGLGIVCALTDARLRGGGRRQLPTAQGPAELLVAPLPEGWETATDGTSGQAYYFNRALNTSQWDRPFGNDSTTEALSASSVPSVPFTVRYTFLNPDGDDAYIRGDGSSMLRSSLCLAETNLAPALLAHPSFGVLPSYLIYTDNHTHTAAESLLLSAQRFVTVAARTRLVNLDMDREDVGRLAALADLKMDAKNTASVRRTLADAVYLPPGRVTGARLLLGTDVSFLREPSGLLERAAALNSSQALYIADLRTFDNKLYTLANYTGPQCAGLLGDFMYLAPGVNVSLSKLQEVMVWYGALPRVPERIHPPCGICTELSAGLHAIDQFAWVAALGLAVSPPGDQGCFALDSLRYQHLSGAPRALEAEAVHDKEISTCVL